MMYLYASKRDGRPSHLSHMTHKVVGQHYASDVNYYPRYYLLLIPTGSVDLRVEKHFYFIMYPEIKVKTFRLVAQVPSGLLSPTTWDILRVYNIIIYLYHQHGWPVDLSTYNDIFRGFNLSSVFNRSS